MKLLVVVILVIGIVMVIQGYTKQNMKCDPPIIKYKYIPMTFDQQQDALPKPSEVFKTMFKGTDPLTYQSG